MTSPSERKPSAQTLGEGEGSLKALQGNPSGVAQNAIFSWREIACTSLLGSLRLSGGKKRFFFKRSDCSRKQKFPI